MEQIKVYDFVRVRGNSAIKIVTDMRDGIAKLIGVDLNEDKDTILYVSSEHRVDTLLYVSDLMVNTIGLVWVLREELKNGTFNKFVYEKI